MIKDIIDKAILDIKQLKVFKEDKIIEAFLGFHDIEGGEIQDTVDKLENIGSFEFQNSRTELLNEWSEKEDGDFGITWGDICDLEVKEIDDYLSQRKKTVYLEDKEQILDILNNCLKV